MLLIVYITIYRSSFLTISSTFPVVHLFAFQALLAECIGLLAKISRLENGNHTPEWLKAMAGVYLTKFQCRLTPNVFQNFRSLRAVEH